MEKWKFGGECTALFGHIFPAYDFVSKWPNSDIFVLARNDSANSSISEKKEFCPMRGPPYSICNIVQSKSDNDIKIVWYHILKFQIFFICLLYLTCLCFLPCLKNRKRNWSYRQSRHDNMHALDNCDDVAQAKAAVAAPQWIIFSNPNSINVFWNFFFLSQEIL